MENANKVVTLKVGMVIQGVGLYIHGPIIALGDLVDVYRKPGVKARYVTCQRGPGSWVSTMVRDGEFMVICDGV